MGLKDQINSFFDELKTNFTPTKAITSYHNGWFNIANESGPSLMLVLDKGSLETITTSATKTNIDVALFIQNRNSTTQQDDLLTYLEEIYAFLTANPRLGGIQDSEVLTYDIAISDDGKNLGLLTIEMQLTLLI